MILSTAPFESRMRISPPRRQAWPVVMRNLVDHAQFYSCSHGAVIRFTMTLVTSLKRTNTRVNSRSGEVLHDQTNRELVYRRLQFHERGQHFIDTHDEAVPVAMRVNNPDCSAVIIQHQEVTVIQPAFSSD